MSAARSGAWRWSAARTAASVAGGASVADVVESGWEGPAARWEQDVHAVVHTDPAARAAAAAAVTAGPLRGVPVLVKDNLCTVDYPTTCASKILAGWRSARTPAAPCASPRRSAACSG